ncbi:NUDIX domain-containing protein [Dothidotthia symphoricarpi CBS 119687]|uniref:NUDIX domain-containing protein n=1 Tax=Dothidotthia symphoricarpi CBS 119687 TaxID=1392245 RepID=A0A6A6ANM3_9PLEO|nr:NUDIX domain-containing protein [Dothidotthia symphoricarpi CBS 119687]KAF2132793.1 NUDIX domain-containing protein [Dothidotthia symphoricarpi CBS 119687]
MRPTAWLAQSKAIATMALSQSSIQALARLRAYNPPPTQWYNCPLTRRAAVLILLFPDHHGDLKVVLTMRSAHLRNYAGQAALPGGKTDSLDESPFATARREAYEEVGLPWDEGGLGRLKGFKVEHLCELPANLARTELGVRPCVAFLRPDKTPSASSSSSGEADDVSVEERLIPRLDPKEVAAVFTAPFANFLHKEWKGEGPGPVQKNGKPEKWYRGSWTDWHESKWRMHNFYIPRPAQSPSSLAKNPSQTSSTSLASAPSAQPEGDDPRPEPTSFDDLTAFRVFGMTARIMVDAARVAYGAEPEFEHNSHFGDEEMIGRLLKMGRLSQERKKGEVLTREVIREASKM